MSLIINNLNILTIKLKAVLFKYYSYTIYIKYDLLYWLNVINSV